jgi:hypothetical protein
MDGFQSRTYWIVESSLARAMHMTPFANPLSAGALKGTMEGPIPPKTLESTPKGLQIVSEIAQIVLKPALEHLWPHGFCVPATVTIFWLIQTASCPLGQF